MFSFLRYELGGRHYVTADLSFDLAYWHEKGVPFLTQVTPPLPIAHIVEQPNTLRRKWETQPHANRMADAQRGLVNIPRGRALLGEELQFLASDWQDALQWLYLEGKAVVLPGVSLKEKRCNRCGQTSPIHFASCASCKQLCAYCSLCLQMGRSKACMPLYYISAFATPFRSTWRRCLQWKGELTSAQQKASDRALALVDQTKQQLLIWAVCGAGKTEVTFPPIERALQQGQKVLLVTPRKDVVLELYPRFQAAFPEVKIVALHGSSKEKWEEAELTLSTTHQAIRFYQRFDLIVIDEVDAFPYHNNPMLYYAVDRALKPLGNQIYLSATPPVSLRKLDHVRIPARYHRKPLAIPQIILKRSNDSFIQNVVRYLIQNKRQAFFFVPFIEMVEELVEKLTQNPIVVAGTHSRDPQREEKVKLFRAGETRILVTTTILERGVTVPKVDVLVIGADAPIFDEASLVQISGRAGRSLEDPIGHVVFLARDKTREMVKAVKHIKEMNQTARKKGLLDA